MYERIKKAAGNCEIVPKISKMYKRIKKKIAKLSNVLYIKRAKTIK